MFSGIGGFELGIQRAFDNRYKTPQEQPNTDIQRQRPDHSKQHVQGTITCVGYSEIDKYAIKTYEEHFDHDNYGDATKISANELPDFDLLVGGFPCQAFSVAGKRAGFDDTRGTLFFDIARILAEKRPRHLVLENVKGLLSHDSGKTFQTIVGVLTNLGYFVEWQVLNSKDFGVPQNRERVFIVGHLGGEPRRKVFPIIRSNGAHLAEITTGVSDAQRIYEPTIAKAQKALGGGLGAKTGLYAIRQPLRYLNRNQKNIAGDYSYTVDSSQTSGIKQGTRIRRLTPLECERLQGFPDDWTVGSDTQRYKQCGNAVTVNVVEAVMDGLWTSNS